MTAPLPRRRRSLKTRVVSQFAVFIVLALLPVGLVVAYTLATTLKNQLRFNLEEEVRTYFWRLDREIGHLAENLDRLAVNPLIVNGLVDPKGRGEYLTELAANFAEGRDVLSFMLVDFDGKAVFADRDQAPDYNQSIPLRTALALGKRTAFVDVDGNGALVLVAPISYYQTIQGAIVVGFDLHALVSRNLKAGIEDRMNLWCGTRRVFGGDFGQDEDEQREMLVVHVHATDSEPNLRDLGIHQMVRVPESVFMRPVYEVLLKIGVVGLVVLAGAVAFALWVGTSIASPILELCSRVENSGLGREPRIAPIGTGDELEDLAVAFEARSRELREIQDELENRVEARTRELTTANETLAQAQKIAHLGSWEWDIASGDLSWSDEMFRIFGLEPQSCVPTYAAFLAAIEPSEQADVDRRVREALDDPRAITYQADHRIVRPDGSVRFVHERADIERDKAGRPVRMVGIVLDVTEVKEAEISLREARERALEASRAKTMFLANMSHEIRTPMNGVIGMLDLLSGTGLTDEQRHYASTALRSAEMQLAVINDILDFSKIEAGKLELETMPFDIGATLEGIVLMLAEQAVAKKVEIACFITPETPPYVLGDPTRVRQVFINLIGNAIKFTDAGSVAVSVSRVTDEGKTVRLLIEVRDTGVGIPKETQERLFQSFVQADNSTTRKFGGTGLGLAISRELVLLMGGSVEVESEPGVGSTFRVSLPFGKSDTLCRVIPKNLSQMTILVVDDNPIAREIFERYFTAWGIRHRIAKNGHEALGVLEDSARDGAAVDLAILDYHMPGMDGIELARRIHENKRIPPLHLVLLSSSQPPDVAALKRIGVSMWLMKPIRQSSLMDALMGPGAAAERLESHDDDTLPRFSARVLLVEDTMINREVARGLLAKVGIVPDIAVNGREAVERTAASTYDLILMDVQMPEMDGFDATRAIRERERAMDAVHVPIVAMTAHALEGDREKCLAIGMNDYLAKPVRQAIFYLTLGRWLTPVGPAVARTVEDDDSGAIDAIPVSRTQPLDMIGFETLKASLSMIPGGLEQVLSEFRATVPRLLREIDAGLEAESPDSVYRPAHGLKSAAAAVGALALSELARKIETLGRQGTTAGVSELLAGAKREWTEVDLAVENALWREIAT